MAITALTARVISRHSKKKEHKLHLLLMRKLIIVLVFIMGGVIAISQIPNFDNIFATILTGSGIAALAISLAAQESLGNFISGVVISSSKPFEVGDRIRLVNGNITGNIEDITLRHTVVRTFLNSRIIIPNSVINSDMIENSSVAQEKSSNFLNVTITYDSDMKKAMEIMAEVVGEHPNYVDVRGLDEMDQPKVPIYVGDLSIYGVNLKASVWTRSVFNNFVTCSEIRSQLKTEFDKSGIKFASGILAPSLE